MSDRSNMSALYGAGLFFAWCLVVPSPVLADLKVSGDISAPSPYQLRRTSDGEYRLNAAYRPEVPSDVFTPLGHLPYAGEIAAAARSSNLDPALVHALIFVESRHRQEAVSPKGAVGLMQLMPNTAIRYGVKSPGKSHTDNLLAGTRYLRDLLDLFGNRLELALAAYNAGEGAVQKYGNRVPPYAETRSYVPSVLEKYKEWQAPGPSLQVPVVYLTGTRLDPQKVADSFLVPR